MNRVFTAQELAYCIGARHQAAPSLAARFAAKEATLKALRIGDEAIGWRSVEIHRHADGWCDLVLHGDARALAERRGVSDLSVSLSHDGAYATAVVVGERRMRRRLARTPLARKVPRGAYER